MSTAAKHPVVRARIHPELKIRATRMPQAMGLTVSDVLSDVMIRVGRDKELPFEVRTSLGPVLDAQSETISEEQFWSRKHALQAADHAKATNGTLQAEETLMIPARMLKGAVPRWPQDAFTECEVKLE